MYIWELIVVNEKRASEECERGYERGKKISYVNVVLRRWYMPGGCFQNYMVTYMGAHSRK